MTLDDLVKIYNDKVFEILAVGDISLTILDAKRAGIRAVVEALRDELLRKEGPDTHNLSERIGLRVAVKMFDDILGGAGNEKAAGGPTREDGQQDNGCITPDSPKPAADLSSHCEWTRHGDVATASCSKIFATVISGRKNGDDCPLCWQTIKFKEAK